MNSGALNLAGRHARVEFEAVLELGGDPEATLRAVARLRDAALIGPRLSWRGRLAGPIEAALLCHLPPPVALRNGAGVAAAWRQAYRYGSCFYRLGPGFIEVKDGRDPDVTVRTLLDDPASVGAFTTCLAPAVIGELQPAQREAVRRLVNRGLVLETAGLALTLPFRMSKWPVPFMSV